MNLTTKMSIIFIVGNLYFEMIERVGAANGIK